MTRVFALRLRVSAREFFGCGVSRAEKIRGCGNRATELALLLIFRANGITGWRRNRAVFSRPDFVFPKRAADLGA